MKNPRDIIKKPIITEQSSQLMEANKYTFVVDNRANKTEIKQAIETIFDVKVVNVNTQNVKGKPKRFGRYSGYTSDWKKATITLSEDSKAIEFFEGV
ncbi:50S ribosomal protein L23 [Desulfuribacillus alkaliarsenatis]|uniref:Large ribosomal subunit protein uL23 n=1 Tax=Desulfuribacillus alkaliarsenatis TaxID=766136 RepID=A0A1E5G4B3_9FIRM|nr:50S ribosomal protein L23 [Desulfuribacillus alkaliarsenatis]OEF97936.1 50S ribosomal protein L23 [Desulfuribacillus alkaliarsenatis]